MATRLPPLNPLRAFEATARHGSVSAAARELNVTHGAISHQIRALEVNLGIGLFERSGQRVKLSAQGALLLPTVSAAFESIASATAQITRPATSGDLTIACVPALLSFWLLPRINQFTEQFPDVRLTLVPSNDPAGIHRRGIDVHILYGDGNWPDCWVKHWTDLELFPVISPTLLNKLPLRTVRDLRNHVILHGDDGREWHAWLAAVDALDLLRARHHFLTDARISIEAATYGNGVALGDSMTVVDMLAKGSLIVPFDRSVPAVHSFYVACRNEMRDDADRQGFHRLGLCGAGRERREGRTARLRPLEPAPSRRKAGGSRGAEIPARSVRAADRQTAVDSDAATENHAQAPWQEIEPRSHEFVVQSRGSRPCRTAHSGGPGLGARL